MIERAKAVIEMDMDASARARARMHKWVSACNSEQLLKLIVTKSQIAARCDIESPNEKKFK